MPIREMGTVDIALWLETLGNTSAEVGFRFESGQTVHAYGYRVVVRIDPVTLRPVPWAEDTRTMLTERLLTGSM